MKLWDKLAELLYPSRARCLGCGDLAGTGDADWLCGDCRRKLHPKAHTAHSDHWGADGISKGYFALYYGPPISGLIRAFKYESVYRCADYLVQLMEPVLQTIHSDDYDCLVPVPLHYDRQWTRGFNQAEVLARLIGARIGLPVDTELKRGVNTRKQARLRVSQRRENVKDAFYTKASYQGMRILIVDDVLTTGSTVCACAKALRKAGAADVTALTVAGSHIYRRRRKNFSIILRKK